jgi:2-isopropylmalate synthase
LIAWAAGEETWGTVGVACNIIDAPWQALVDAVAYELCRAERRGLR